MPVENWKKKIIKTNLAPVSSNRIKISKIRFHHTTRSNATLNVYINLHIRFLDRESRLTYLSRITYLVYTYKYTRTFLFSVLLPRDDVLEKMVSWSVAAVEAGGGGPRPVPSWLSRGTVPSSGTA